MHFVSLFFFRGMSYKSKVQLTFNVAQYKITNIKQKKNKLLYIYIQRTILEIETKETEQK